MKMEYSDCSAVAVGLFWSQDMNRFEYKEARLGQSEQFVAKERNIKLYDGEEKTNFEEGEVVLTSHRLFWGRPGEIAAGMRVLCLHLKYVEALDEETASSFLFGKKKRIIVQLRPVETDKAPGPMEYSTASHVKLSGKSGIEEAFVRALHETVAVRLWEVEGGSSGENSPEKRAGIKLRTGIVGIERGIHEKQKQTDESIAVAFQDLKKLMGMAKEMVTVSKAIATKIRNHDGDISEDETIRFKSYLMSLGIDDPVTRGNFSTNSDYFGSLSKQLTEMLLDTLTEAGGMMSLADVYCRVNRARGLELLSPEDLLGACQLMDGPIKLRQFPSGAMVLQLDSHNDEIVMEETEREIREQECLTVEHFARNKGISVLLAQERLFTAERAGRICRDESLEGLRFFPNLFLVEKL
ncbi:vacuolar protein-sorting-associated protein 36 isoform X1 [Phlebotomus argentipes]|uniref:vacuolar protein-sorting-associated protein 36 isoform X1 n=1 Tax=Phlebotomus argentipes TaxID=94469 RepID=UPI0028930581|nr:vacuolar protein-sorting-associated protein 36 isoform X1 [Phlebotomus argentipes]